MKRLPIYLAVGLLACSCTCSKKDSPPKSKPFEWFNCATNDRIYMDSTRYLMSNSPLSFFPDYNNDKIFKSKSFASNHCPTSLYGYFDKYYAAQWVILGDSLYLYALDYDWARNVGSGVYSELFKAAEKLTGRKFTHHPENKGLPYRTSGVIPADWFSGTIQAKAPNDPNKRSPEEETFPNKRLLDKEIYPSGRSLNEEIFWRGTTFWVLTFEKGKLISKRRAKTVN